MEDQITWYDGSLCANTKWDDVHVSGCKNFHAIDHDDTWAEQVDDDQAEFWSVFLHDVNGGVFCVADVPTKKQALLLSHLILSAALSYQKAE